MFRGPKRTRRKMFVATFATHEGVLRGILNNDVNAQHGNEAVDKTVSYL